MPPRGPPVPVSANQGDARRPREPSTLYKLIMTPLIFTTFLLSLALVDLRHSTLRSHYHADSSQATRLPGWLHRLVYRYRPYRYDVSPAATSPAVSPGTPGSSWSGAGSASPGREGEGEDYYHSKQRKLMRMEAEEAFEIRGWVVTVLGVMSLGVVWVGFKVVWWALGAVLV